MKYKTAAAFRHALEERLRQKSLSGGAPLARLRKMVAFDRFLARVTRKQPDAWIVKGGFALQYPLTTQIAEKLHTYTRTYASGETSRAGPGRYDAAQSHV